MRTFKGASTVDPPPSTSSDVFSDLRSSDVKRSLKFTFWRLLRGCIRRVRVCVLCVCADLCVFVRFVRARTCSHVCACFHVCIHSCVFVCVRARATDRSVER